MLKQRQELLDFALQLARAAAEQILPHYYDCLASTKPDGTEVTEADRRAEEEGIAYLHTIRYAERAVKSQAAALCPGIGKRLQSFAGAVE